MYVMLHACVLSISVAYAFTYFGDASTSEKEVFVWLFHCLFDCLNVQSLSEWTKAKPDLKPYARGDNI